MPHAERMEIIAGLKGVDYVLGWDDGSQTVTGAIEIIQPHIFTKGGDRSEAAVVPEFELCNHIGCKVMFGVGGKEKIQSSSDLIKNSNQHDNNNEACPLNDPETFANPVTSGLGCNCK